MMSGGEMDLAWGNKPVEVPDPEDSSTMEESVVTFSGQRRKEPLVGDLESVGSSMDFLIFKGGGPIHHKGSLFPYPN
jgi:hypothetical protein